METTSECRRLEELIAGAEEYGVVQLRGDYRLQIGQSLHFVVGKSYAKNLVTVTRPNVTVDGSGSRIVLETGERIDSDLNLFCLSKSAHHVTLRNLTIQVLLDSPASNFTFTAVQNFAFGLKLIDCRIEVTAKHQINLNGLVNDGRLFTHLETPADNLTVEGCHLAVTCAPEEFPRRNLVRGIVNQLANSISVQNTFVYATTKGCGEEQEAVGVFTSGRFGRFVGNNIKANGSHNVGKQLEQAHACGLRNEGMYTILSANNIVGEWAGKSVGLDNRGEYAKVSGNKILATHTIKGRSIVSLGNNSVIDGNIITSTSRNPRLIEHWASYCVISGNYLEALMPYWEDRSSVGIFAVGNGSLTGNLIAGNLIRNVCDCGIFLESKQAAKLEHNVIATFEDWKGIVDTATADDVRLSAKLDETNIVSIE